MKLNEQELRDITEIGKKARGRSDLIKYLKGGELSALQAIRAHCYWCNGYCSDGREICEEKSCPLWPHNPYTPKKKRVMSEKQRINAQRLGAQTKENMGHKRPRIDFQVSMNDIA
ncbi:hypothetical protein [Syntrophorhabdus aromaticivorans]|uniref:hypothetical protein n=1 Tax=Syntrophorhabdus aromaticivorans TaxID=328301 RepID=UPI0004253513|nr:hypothetical protein [Syntrophorhabdus aromaticivorans]